MNLQRWARWLAMAVIAVASAGCSERSSLLIENDSGQSVVVRVFFNDFGESFGFKVPAGVRGWGWAPLEGRVVGPIAVYDDACNLTWHEEIRPDGGHLTLNAAGEVALEPQAAPPSEAAAITYLEYTDTCADSGSPRR
jgi:hypothetical protein